MRLATLGISLALACVFLGAPVDARPAKTLPKKAPTKPSKANTSDTIADAKPASKWSKSKSNVTAASYPGSPRAKCRSAEIDGAKK